MKKLLFVAAAAAAVLSSCGGGAGSLKSEKDSLAYAVGVDLGLYVRQLDSVQKLNLDLNAVCASLKETATGKGKMSPDDAMMFLREYFMVRVPAKNKVEGEEFLSEVEKKANVKKTESGLLYEIIREGSDVKATSDADRVRVMYEGKLKDGTVFDSSYERGDTAEFPLNGVIKGWGEGMKLVGEGGKIKLWVPSELGYGENGAGTISPNEPLVFEIELIGVTPAAAAE